MNIDINTDPRLSPTERMVLQQVRDRLQQEPRRLTDRVIVEALDEALGCDDARGGQ